MGHDLPGAQGLGLFPSCSSNISVPCDHSQLQEGRKGSSQEVENGLVDTVCHPGLFITVGLLLRVLEAFTRFSAIAN